MERGRNDYDAQPMLTGLELGSECKDTMVILVFVKKERKKGQPKLKQEKF